MYAGDDLRSIRHIAICVFRDRDRILVARGYDDVKNEYFFRPLGGAIEFGELAEDALRREILEELALEVKDPVRLGVLENRFEYRGVAGHEIVFVFDAAFADEAVYFQPSVPFFESGWSAPAEWLDLSRPLPHRLVPAGLDKLLQEELPRTRRRGDSAGLPRSNFG